MKICLIEEDKVLTRINSDFLSDLGHEVVSFDSISGFIKVQSEKRGTPDAIVIDSFISHKEHVAALREIRKIFPETKVIVMCSPKNTEDDSSYAGYSFGKTMNLNDLELALINIDLNGKG